MSEETNARSMMKSELIERIARKQSHLAYKDVELAVKSLLEQMSNALSGGERIEIRGFGSFSLHFRPPRIGRNPKTKVPYEISERTVVTFYPSKVFRKELNPDLNI